MNETWKLLPALLLCAACATMDEKSERNGSVAAESSATSKTITESESETVADTPAPVRAEPPRSTVYGLTGYAVYEDDGRLWVFKEGSEHHRMFLDKGEPAKRVTLVGEGPDGRTIMGANKGALTAYAVSKRYAREGFAVHGTGAGRLWVFKPNSPSHMEYLTQGEPGRRVTLIGAGPDGRTIMSDERAIIDTYLFGRPGFAVIPEDGRLWIFREGSEAHRMFEEKGEPAQRVTLVGAGPMGKTIMGADREALAAYLGASRQ